MPVPTTVAPSRRTLMHEEAQHRITDAIVRGVLAPGERLAGDELCAWLDVSRTTLNRALVELEHLGLVESSPNRFTRVACPAHTDIADGVVALAPLWRLGAELTLTLADPSAIAAHRLAIQQMRLSCLTPSDIAVDREAVIAGLQGMFGFFLQQSGNDLLRATAAPLESRVQHAARRSSDHFDHESLARVAADLEDALNRRDLTLVQHCIDAFVDLARDHTQRAIDADLRSA